MALQPPVIIPSATATTTSGSTPISLLQNGIPARQFYIQNNGSVDMQFSFDGTNFLTLKAGLAIGVSDALMKQFFVKTASSTTTYEAMVVSHDL